MFNVFRAALLIAAIWLASEKVEVIQPLTGSKSSTMEVQSGGLLLREGEVGAAFGSVQVGKGKRQLSYFVVFKHNAEKAEKSDFNENVNAGDTAGDSKQVLSIDGRTVEIVYKVSAKDGKKTSDSVLLTANKEKVDAKGCRVFLVDLTASPPTVEPIKAELTEEVDAGTKRAAEELGKKVLTRLAKQDKKVQEFIDKAKK